MNEVNPYYKLVIQNIVSTKTFDISEVNNLESIRSLTFEQDDYKLIVGLIKEQNWEGISAIEKAPNGFREYLDIIRFSDQHGNTNCDCPRQRRIMARPANNRHLSIK